jgi:hypothetical protein
VSKFVTMLLCGKKNSVEPDASIGFRVTLKYSSGSIRGEASERTYWGLRHLVVANLTAIVHCVMVVFRTHRSSFGDCAFSHLLKALEEDSNDVV